MAGNANSGRKRLPGNVHVLQGSKSKAAGSDQVALPPVAIPDAPDHLSADARAEWDRVTPLLEQMGIIADIYRAPLAVYCQAWGRYVQAERKLVELGEDGTVDTTPSGYKQIGVWLQVSNRAADQMKAFASEFGMTPSAIQRVTNTAPQGDLFGFGNDNAKQKAPGRFFT